jgi:hypothetical protein
MREDAVDVLLASLRSDHGSKNPATKQGRGGNVLNRYNISATPK